MKPALKALRHLISKRSDEIVKIVAGTGYLPKTVIGIGTFLLDNEGDIDLLTANQRVIFDKFLQPLLDRLPGNPSVASPSSTGSSKKSRSGARE